uniref:PRONE domain-containing protein n=1 Tax=Zea mays TaxID=4577 RepID=A0A804QXU3_MAIZE
MRRQVVALHEEKDLMKEKFAKLLLGEDMSGSGKEGALRARPLQRRHQPRSLCIRRATEAGAHGPGQKGEVEERSVGWILSIADHIVEFVAKKQVMDNDTEMEVLIGLHLLHLRAAVTLSSARHTQLMGTQQRRDLQANIPALRKLDTMLLDYLDNFKERNEFWYVKRDSCSESENEPGEGQREMVDPNRQRAPRRALPDL